MGQQERPGGGEAGLHTAAGGLLCQTQTAAPSENLGPGPALQGYLHKTRHHGSLPSIPSGLDAVLSRKAPQTAWSGGRRLGNAEIDFWICSFGSGQCLCISIFCKQELEGQGE